MRNSKVLAIVNTITFMVMLFVNYASATGLFSALTVADVSHKYDTLFAPAGYAFIIWSFIFLLCLGFVAFQWQLIRRGDHQNYIERTGIWFTVSNIANTCWLFCWTNEMMGSSVILIVVLLLSLCIICIRLRLELDDEPVRIIFFVWWPIVFYLGWVIVATVACISSWLVYSGWHGGDLGESIWTIIMILIAGILYYLLTIKRNMREAALVGIWAFIAMAVRQWDAHNNIAVTALIVSAVLMVFAAYQGYKNRYFSPIEKLKRGEWK